MAKVKICGITNLEDALTAQEAGADILGFIFAESPRRIDAIKAAAIIDKLHPDTKISALFVNEDRDRAEDALKKLGRVDLLQFHGDETPDYCSQFKARDVIKAFRIKDERSLAVIKKYPDVDYLLLDTYDKACYGGTGETFDWSIAKKAKEFDKPIFLAGGLNPDNIGEAVVMVRPFAVDVTSGVEKAPGKKDPELIRRFIAIAKSV